MMDSGAVGSHASALDAWWAYPVSARPRPLVFVDRPVRIGDAGFVDGPSKSAYVEGAIEASVALPPGVLDLLVGGRTGRLAARLRVVGIESVEAPFQTDRGPRNLPAYKVEMTGLRQPCTVLDPQTALWWPPAGQWE